MINATTNSIIGAAANSALDTVVPLQQRLADAPPAIAMAGQPGAGPDAGLDSQALALLAALRQLPPAASNSAADKQAQINAIAKLLRQFKNPQDGTPAFNTLEQQRAVLQRMLELAGPDDSLHAPLAAATMSTINLQFQMKQWMQDVILSNGTPPECQDW